MGGESELAMREAVQTIAAATSLQAGISRSLLQYDRSYYRIRSDQVTLSREVFPHLAEHMGKQRSASPIYEFHWLRMLS